MSMEEVCLLGEVTTGYIWLNIKYDVSYKPRRLSDDVASVKKVYHQFWDAVLLSFTCKVTFC